MSDIQGKIVIVSLLQLPEYLKNKGLEPDSYIEEEEILVVRPITPEQINSPRTGQKEG